MRSRRGSSFSHFFNLALLIVSGISQNGAEASEARASEYTEASLGPELSEIVTNVVLLADSGGVRVRRGAVVPLNTSSEELGSEDSSHIYASGEDQGSSRGHPPDPLLKELENNVDITDKKIFQNIDEQKISEGLTSGPNDTHKYYKQIFYHRNKFSQYYQDLGVMNTTGTFKGKVKEHSMLSQSYRRAATINLSFKFPFYGHEVENITIATGGFLYTGDYVHSWLAATQYIAPLMANFDTSNNQQAKIRYLDDGMKLIVEWKDVYLQERETEGPFTFQVTLHKQGDIWFAYQKIPLEIISIKDDDHPVKVGLSDAYIIDRTIYFARRKTIYEYHRLNMKDQEIKNETAIVFRALETCNTYKECDSCLAPVNANPLKADLLCRWCPELGRCSDGTDRNRQDWLKRKCDIHNISNSDTCSLSKSNTGYGGDDHDYQEHGLNHHSAKMSDYGDKVFPSEPSPENPAGAIVGAVFSCLLLLTLLGWVGYAYFNPNTTSGRFLIKYRPGAWRWRQAGGRYTAASIHM